MTHWPTGLVFAFVATYLAVRAAVALSDSGQAGFPSLIPIEIASTICSDIAFIGSAFGMLLASNARLMGEAEAMAHFDPLTNLPNRRLFFDRLLAAEQRAQATGSPLGLIYLDLDEFKLVNDTLGHQAGDELLRKVSAAMSRILRTGDCMARVGGDEFVVLVEDIEDRRELATLAERLKAAVETNTISGKLSEPARVSYGAAIFPDDGDSVHNVMREADTEMYLAKRQRRLARR